ncbi:hypothetical protein [Streptomyces sp. NPDC087300]|uniref:hypothetical protein n=1 Tax=Streptomyces sp. NPDC087300 TaxID=3365780 RepID=UPI003803D204
MISDRLGVRAEAAGWCAIDKIPDPPGEVLQAAGNPRLRPGTMPPLGMLGTAVGVLLMPLVMLLSLLDSAREALDRLFESKKDEKRRARDDERRRKALVAEQGLDRVFDGNWSAAAGQFLLRWYGHSPHHQRFVVATEDGIVLAAPPKRVSVGRDKRMEVVARLAAGEAALTDPFLGEFRTQLLLLTFHDGSWLRLTTEEFRSELHMYVLRQPSSGN